MGIMTRRAMLATSLGAGAALAAARFTVVELAAQAQRSAAGGRLQDAFRALDQFAEHYLRTMRSPGMTLVVADRGGELRVSTYGFSNVETEQPVRADQPFEVGSITKSFVGIALLQLAEEGKLDLHRPVTEYLPLFKVESKFAPITTHHLLTHSSGLPDGLQVLLSDPNARHRVRYAPGEHFFYCNNGYQALGYLIWTLDGRPFAESIRERIFKPLGMAGSHAALTSELRDLSPRSYNPLSDDRPYLPGDPLKPAPPLIMDDAAGCIACTPRDMGLYIQMLTNRGRLGDKRVLSEKSFELFSTPFIKAEQFGPEVSYGYGIAVEKWEGHKLIRHTGGMVSFASALQVDMDEAVGAFASINAMQGFRPNPVAQYALRLVRAANAGQPLPEPSEVNGPEVVADAKEYAGVFTSPDGKKKMEFVAEGKSLTLLHESRSFKVETNAGQLVVRDPELGRFVLNFQREQGEKGPVTDLVHGPHWYFNANYGGPQRFAYRSDLFEYVGHYRTDNLWYGSFRVVMAKGKLWLDGQVPLEQAGEGEFWLADTPHNPTWVRFFNVMNNKAMQVKFAGQDFWRVLVP